MDPNQLGSHFMGWTCHECCQELGLTADWAEWSVSWIRKIPETQRESIHLLRDDAINNSSCSPQGKLFLLILAARNFHYCLFFIHLSILSYFITRLNLSSLFLNYYPISFMIFGNLVYALSVCFHVTWQKIDILIWTMRFRYKATSYIWFNFVHKSSHFNLSNHCYTFL